VDVHGELRETLIAGSQIRTYTARVMRFAYLPIFSSAIRMTYCRTAANASILDGQIGQK
jgi:hypothetical protein